MNGTEKGVEGLQKEETASEGQRLMEIRLLARKARRLLVGIGESGKLEFALHNFAGRSQRHLRQEHYLWRSLVRSKTSSPSWVPTTVLTDNCGAQSRVSIQHRFHFCGINVEPEADDQFFLLPTIKK